MAKTIGAARGRRVRLRAWLPAALFVMLALLPQAAQARLQCVPYARAVSGIDIHGNALLWWQRAAGRYKRGGKPRKGAVLAFRSTAAMPLGHVAVVSAIIDERNILIDHANWSGPGVIENDVLAQDVSEEGDWSGVRVWWGPTHSLGARANPIAGFIYNDAPEDGSEAGPRPSGGTGPQTIATAW